MKIHKNSKSLGKLIKKINKDNAPPDGWAAADRVTKEKAIQESVPYTDVEEANKPEEGKVYALTGARGTNCIANGNNWKESEVHQLTIRWGSDKEVTKTYTFNTIFEKDSFLKGVDEANGWLEYELVEGPAA
tara:strand:- start:1108 stop:1503 length:396 start_codon:yes stop_codon:yes gene_type:complete